MIETWRPVVGLEGQYEVSDRGRVRNVERVAWRRRGYGPSPDKLYPSRCAEKIRATYTNPDGYETLKLATRGTVAVHVLVLEAFVGPCPPRQEGCHDDGDPGNNNLENLRWDTRKGNSTDMVRHGRSPRGEKHGAVKLNEQAVLAIRARASEGLDVLGQEFGVTGANIRRIVDRKTWRHLP